MTPERICELRNVFTQAFAFGRESEVCIEAHEGLHLLAEAEAAERMRTGLEKILAAAASGGTSAVKYSELAMYMKRVAAESLTPPAEAEKGERE